MTEYYKRYLFFFFCIAFLFVYHIISFQGYFGYDDVEYAQLAIQLMNGDFEFSANHFSSRIAVIALLALSYQLFGVNDFSSMFPSLLMTIFSLLISGS